MTAPGVSTAAVMEELQGRLRERLRARLLERGASSAFADPALFAEVEALLQKAAQSSDAAALMLPELLGDPAHWRLQTALQPQSHRGPLAASVVVSFKRRVLMPMFRWLFEYSRDNFERQRRINQVLFACVQELAVETARLRGEVRRLSSAPPISIDPT